MAALARDRGGLGLVTRRTQAGGKAPWTSSPNSWTNSAGSSGLEVERLGIPVVERAALLGEGDRGLEQALHLERGLDLHPHLRGLIAPRFENLWDAPAGTLTGSPAPAITASMPSIGGAYSG